MHRSNFKNPKCGDVWRLLIAMDIGSMLLINYIIDFNLGTGANLISEHK